MIQYALAVASAEGRGLSCGVGGRDASLGYTYEGAHDGNHTAEQLAMRCNSNYVHLRTAPGTARAARIEPRRNTPVRPEAGSPGGAPPAPPQSAHRTATGRGRGRSPRSGPRAPLASPWAGARVRRAERKHFALSRRAACISPGPGPTGTSTYFSIDAYCTCASRRDIASSAVARRGQLARSTHGKYLWRVRARAVGRHIPRARASIVQAPVQHARPRATIYSYTDLHHRPGARRPPLARLASPSSARRRAPPTTASRRRRPAARAPRRAARRAGSAA